MPFSRCPQCHAPRRILCPVCATALAVRQTCGHCGLHFLFFDKVRREHRRANRHPRAARMSVAARKLMFVVFVLAVGMPLSRGHDARWFALGLMLSLTAVLAWGTAPLRLPTLRRKRAVACDMTAVLETYDGAEAMAARAWLRLSGIDAQTLSVRSPNGGLRRIMVTHANVSRAVACLSDHGFELSASVRELAAPAMRWSLRLVHSAGDRRKERGHD